jgi:hypothetical protein
MRSDAIIMAGVGFHDPVQILLVRSSDSRNGSSVAQRWWLRCRGAGRNSSVVAQPHHIGNAACIAPIGLVGRLACVELSGQFIDSKSVDQVARCVSRRRIHRTIRGVITQNARAVDERSFDASVIQKSLSSGTGGNIHDCAATGCKTAPRDKHSPLIARARG